MGTASPFMGYATKRDAVLALRASGMKPAEIAEKVGWGVGAVYAVKRPSRATAGDVWTEEKVDRVLALLPRVVETVAQMLGVPPLDVQALWIKGRRPKVVKAPPADEPLPEVATTKAIDPDDGFAELETPPAEEVAPEPFNLPAKRDAPEPEPAVFRGTKRPASAPAAKGMYHLVGPGGIYLHQSLDALTPKLAYAWQGTAKQLENVRALRPKLTDGLKAELIVRFK